MFLCKFRVVVELKFSEIGAREYKGFFAVKTDGGIPEVRCMGKKSKITPGCTVFQYNSEIKINKHVKQR